MNKKPKEKTLNEDKKESIPKIDQKHLDQLKQTPKWYIVTSINGNEETVYKNIEDKVRAYNLSEYVHEMRLLKTREITIEVFDPINNPPPSRMVNTKKITWEALPGNRYKKTKIREINSFPGYIYIKMIMDHDIWYVIRNTYGVTGFVGSSGKGVQPIPMSDDEVANLFDPKNNKDIIIHKNADLYVDQTIDKPELEQKKVEFLSLDKEEKASLNDEGFYDSTLNKTKNNDSPLMHQDLNDELFFQNLTKNPKLVEDYLNTNELISSHVKQIQQEKENSAQNDYFNDPFDPKENMSLEEQIYAPGKSHQKSKKFQVGNTVVVFDNDNNAKISGTIVAIDIATQTAKVKVDLLGKDNIMTLDFDKIEKIE